MTEKTGDRKSWETEFLTALNSRTTVIEACRRAGVTKDAAYRFRRANARFAGEWEQALKRKWEPVPQPEDSRSPPNWRALFLEALAETSNVTESAARVKVPTRTVYDLRRKDAKFAARWLAALNEGYDNLELELLQHLRDPQPERKMDVTAALRLLAAHRETVERHRAVAGEEDPRAIFRSIDNFIEGMRQRRAANSAILLKQKQSDGEV